MILTDIAKTRTLAFAGSFFLEVLPRGRIHDLKPGASLMAVVGRAAQKGSVCAVKANSQAKVKPGLADFGTARAFHF
jgi:hypothetical protein